MISGVLYSQTTPIASNCGTIKESIAREVNANSLTRAFRVMPLSPLPEELLLEAFNNLHGIHDLFSVKLTCKGFNTVSKNLS